MTIPSLPDIMVAPNGARRTKAHHPALPLTIAETVADAAACHAAGAGGLHAHVRGPDGEHVLDAGLYRELIAEMAVKVPGMAVQVTTEAVGRYTPAEQRKLVLDLSPAMVSISVREIIADGDAKAARHLFEECAARGVAVQHILYDAVQLVELEPLVGGGSSVQLLFVLGRYADGQLARPQDLDPFLSQLSTGTLAADWAACAFGRRETTCLLSAAARGGKVRVGFENNLHQHDGSLAASNADRVREIVSLLEMGARQAD